MRQDDGGTPCMGYCCWLLEEPYKARMDSLVDLLSFFSSAREDKSAADDDVSPSAAGAVMKSLKGSEFAWFTTGCGSSVT